MTLAPAARRVAVRSAVLVPPMAAALALAGAASAGAQGYGTVPSTTVPGTAAPGESTAGLIVFIVVLVVLAGGALYLALQARANRLRRAAAAGRDPRPPGDPPP